MVLPADGGCARYPGVLFVFLTVLITRLPFLGPGYGVDPDAWRVVGAARAFAATGIYEYSRMPGHSPHELIVSLAADAPAYLLNLSTAAVSALAAAIFWLILRHYQVRDSFLATFAFALTPIVYIESVELLDYMWSLACVLGALYAMLNGYRLLSGALLGIGVGFGITISLMLIPLVLIAMAGQSALGHCRGRVIAVSEVVIPAVTTGLLCYALPYLSYGPEFLWMPDTQPRSVLVAAWIASVGVFGIPGALIVAAVSAVAVRDSLVKKPIFASMSARPHPLVVLAWISVPVVYGLFYFRIRGEPSKLIPVVPFMILILAKYADRKTFLIMCIALLISAFTGQLFKNVVPAVPSIVEYAATRRNEMERIAAIWRTLEREPGRSLVITGSYFEHKMRLTRPLSTLDRVEIKPWVTAQDIDARRAAGMSAFCFPEACQWNKARMGVDPRDHGASALAER